MKVKVNFFDRQLRREYYSILSVISLIISFILIFKGVPDEHKSIAAIIFGSILVIIYIVLWIRANMMQKIRLEVNNSVLEIKVGDIFEEKEFKVIAFNEYFDTQVDEKIISSKTLNGKYIKGKVDDINNLDKLIEKELTSRNLESVQNSERKIGKKYKYALGTVVKNGDYLLVAFSKFDNENRAYLSLEDYISCLLNFWNEVDIVYNGNSVSIPVLGSGITRFKGYDMIKPQELLELLIWSFKVSKVKFSYSSKVTIIIHKSQIDKINLYKLKEESNGL